MYKKGYIQTAALGLLFGMLLAGCGSLFSTPIKKIIDNPRDYSGKEVTISGEVTETFGLIVMKYFVVRDSTGEIAVITSKPLPKKGDRIKVRGTVQEAFSLGDQQLIVIIEREAPGSPR
jgi:hypothetical protein